MKIPIIYSPQCLKYGGLASPENSQRVLFAAQNLQSQGYNFINPLPASEKDILAVHSKSYLDSIKKGTISDPDTPTYDNIFNYAQLAAGGAILAAQQCGFSLMRPPGHHCGVNGKAMGAFTRGFCYFNNLAIAVRKINRKLLLLILTAIMVMALKKFLLIIKNYLFIFTP